MKGKREKEKAVTNWDPVKCGGDGMRTRSFSEWWWPCEGQCGGGGAKLSPGIAFS